MAVEIGTISKRRPVVGGNNGWWKRLERWMGIKAAFSVKRRVSFYRRLAKFAGRGVPVPEAIEGMWTRYEGRNSAERHVFREIYMRLDNGSTVSAAMGEYIPAVERTLIQAGETSGTLQTGFEMAAVLADGARRMRTAIATKLMEPIILVLMMVGILVVATYFVIPVFLQLDPNVDQWPFTPRMLHHIAFYIREWGIVTLVVAIAVGFWLKHIVPRWTGNVRRFCDKHVPPFTVYRAYTNAGFLLALGELTRNGTPIADAVQIMAPVSSPWLRWHLSAMAARLADGVEPGRAIDVGMLDQATMDDVEDYMRAASFSDALAALGEDAVEDGIARVNRAVSVVFGLTLTAVGFVMILIAVGPMMLAQHKMDQVKGGPNAMEIGK